MNLIEVSICDRVFVIPYDDHLTISGLGEIALYEYQNAFYDRGLSKVKFVQDGKNRILAGTLLVNDQSVEKKLTVELIDNDNSNMNNNIINQKWQSKDDICEQYMSWQKHTASRAKKVLEAMADSDSRIDPSDEFIDMLRDLRKSRFEIVQQLIVECFSLMLDYFRVKKYTSCAMYELQCVVKESNYANAIMMALKKISTSRTMYKYIQEPKLFLSDVQKHLSNYDESIQRDYFELYDYLEEAQNTVDSGGIQNTADNQLILDMNHNVSMERLLSLLVSDINQNRSYALYKIGNVIVSYYNGIEKDRNAINWHKVIESILSCIKKSLKPPNSKFRSASHSDGNAGHVTMVETIRAAYVATLALNSVESNLNLVSVSLLILCAIASLVPILLNETLSKKDLHTFCKLLTTLAHAPTDVTVVIGDEPKLDGIKRFVASKLWNCGENSKIPCIADLSSYILLFVAKDDIGLQVLENLAIDRLSHPDVINFDSISRITKHETCGFDVRPEAKWCSPDNAGAMKIENRALQLLIKYENTYGTSSKSLAFHVDLGLIFLLQLSLKGIDDNSKNLSVGRSSFVAPASIDSDRAKTSDDITRLLADNQYELLKQLWGFSNGKFRLSSQLSIQILSVVSTLSVVQSFFSKKSFFTQVNFFLIFSSAYLCGRYFNCLKSF
jgi:hypothetical protein